MLSRDVCYWMNDAFEAHGRGKTHIEWKEVLGHIEDVAWQFPISDLENWQREMEAEYTNTPAGWKADHVFGMCHRITKVLRDRRENNGSF